MKSSLQIALVAFMGCASLRANAQPAPAAPLPYAPWDGHTALPAPPPLRDPAPGPLARDAEYARRTVELGPELGVALPSCAGRVDRAAPCAALAPGPLVGVSALYRPNPYFAFGGGFHAAWFGAQSEMAPAQSSGRLLELAVLARVYLLESGRLEPYFELGFGVGTQLSEAAPLGEPSFEQRSIAAGGHVAGGVDFYLGESFRLGPSISALRFFSGTSDRCAQNQRCSAATLDEHGQLLAAYALGVKLSLGLGSRL